MKQVFRTRTWICHLTFKMQLPSMNPLTWLIMVHITIMRPMLVLLKYFQNGMVQDNVALIAVLEALVPPFPQANGPDGGDKPNRRQLLCVANTHIHANPELNDVKLWQVQLAYLINPMPFCVPVQEPVAAGFLQLAPDLLRFAWSQYVSMRRL